MAIGALAAVPSYFGILWRSRTALDDSLDVVAAHGVGGATGALLTGVFATAAAGGTDGLLAGNPRQVAVQALGIGAAMLYSGVATAILLKLIGLVTPLRGQVRDEAIGMDVTQHGEEAYTHGEGAVLVAQSAPAGAPEV
jgi:Amt family ammonium transporter